MKRGEARAMDREPSPERAARARREAVARRAAAREAERLVLVDELRLALAERSAQLAGARVTLFGSAATGLCFDADRSDLDLFIEGEVGDPFELAGWLTGRLRIPVHVIPASRAPESLRACALRDGQVVYGG